MLYINSMISLQFVFVSDRMKVITLYLNPEGFGKGMLTTAGIFAALYIIKLIATDYTFFFMEI